MEGRPITKCACFFSDRGRNSKGIIEKSIESVFGGYYSAAACTVFAPRKGDENQHDAATIDRQGRRVIVANEVGEKWGNAEFKSKNSRDKVAARGRNQSTVTHFNPTYSYVFMTNDPPGWVRPPKGSGRDRLPLLRLPSRYVTPREEQLGGPPEGSRRTRTWMA